MGDTPCSIGAGNALTSRFDDPIGQSIMLDDDTLRDGEQTVGVCFTLEQKVEIAKLLLEAGIHRLSVGFPAVSQEEQRAARAVLALGYDDRILYALCRANTEDVDTAAACGAKHIGVFVPISDLHLRYKLRCDEDAALARYTRVIRYARDKGLLVGAGMEDASRAPLERVIRFARAAGEAGAYFALFCDTVGTLTPRSTWKIMTEVVGALGDLPLGVHFHNDLGMATANAIVALQAGVRIVQGSFAGLGERAGNVCLEEVATILRVKYGREVVDLEKLTHAARRIAEIAKLPVAPCKPIIGANVFSHESGIHVHGVTSEPATYEAFPPAIVGRSHEVKYGKHSGLHSVSYLARVNGIAASDAALEETLRRIKAISARRGCPTPEEAAAILRGVAAEVK